MTTGGARLDNLSSHTCDMCDLMVDQVPWWGRLMFPDSHIWNA